jgi:hypothetical protein
MTVRDRLWLWGHEEGAHNGQYNLPGESRIGPAGAADYLGIRNVVMVRYGGNFDARHYAESLQGMDRVVWSIVGAGGRSEGGEIPFVREMAARYPNWRGVIMDDFFAAPGPDEELAVHSPDTLRTVQEQLWVGGRKLDLWVVLYAHQLDLPVGPHLEQCDVVSLWTWRAADLEMLEAALDRLDDIAPDIRKVLGCYMWDYGEKRPIPLASMQRQCDLGLEWVRDGRIEGMIFLPSCICDLGLETVEWTREWIRYVGDEPVLPP